MKNKDLKEYKIKPPSKYKFTKIIDELYNELQSIVDTKVTSEKAFADQKIKINKFGGREKILSLGDFGYSPAPVGNTKN